jgi:hypothetical protein
LGQGCGCDDELSPAAGVPTFVQHGALAAGLAADAILHDELGPARKLRLRGGTEPVITATPLPDAEDCSLFRAPWEHGPAAWQRFMDLERTTIGQLLDAAYCELGRGPGGVAVELDVPLCLHRACSNCRRQAPAAFRISAPNRALCSDCGQPLRQESLPAAPLVEAAQLEPLRERTLAGLSAPRGAGFRFVSDRGQFCACVGGAPRSN